MKIQKFTKSYDGHKVLNFPGITFAPGKIYAVIGANGSGKSTFAKILANTILTDQKENVVDKNVIVGYMPQKSYAFRMSVEKNIALGGKNPARIQELMFDLQIQHLAKKTASRLSGGETARMALARVMMKNFDLLILDEPTAAMDMETTSLAEDLILRYCKETNASVILVTHSLQQARRVADEVLFLYKGNLVEYGVKEQVLFSPLREETKKFLEFYGV